MKLNVAMCEALVDGWHGDWFMGRVVSHAWRLTDQEPENETEKFALAAKAVGAKSIWGADKAQTWIPRNLRSLNEALWAGRKRESCVAIARKSLGIHTVGGNMTVKVRERDKRSDWATVK